MFAFFMFMFNDYKFFSVFFYCLGDILYIPAYSWYHVMSTEGINYVKIEFDVFSYEFQHDIPYLKV